VQGIEALITITSSFKSANKCTKGGNMFTYIKETKRSWWVHPKLFLMMVVKWLMIGTGCTIAICSIIIVAMYGYGTYVADSSNESTNKQIQQLVSAIESNTRVMDSKLEFSEQLSDLQASIDKQKKDWADEMERLEKQLSQKKENVDKK
jgi:biopolymer transport protein ExbB/TolQ